jgi:hypothetical protein
MFRNSLITRTAVTLLLLPVLYGRNAPAGEPSVELQTADNHTVTITIDGQPFGTLNAAPELPKPFLLPVRTATGVVINRALNDESDPDHPHHKGLWVSVDEVSGLRFWNENAPIRNLAVRILRTGKDVGILETVNQWCDPETGAPKLTETTTVTIHPNRLLVYDILLTASHGSVVFEDTKEGLLGFRVAPSMKERNGGRIVASDGTTGESNCWGRKFPWIDYTGEVDGKTAGIALMDHPDNPRPSRYHVRSYGLFAINPFGEAAYTKGQNEPSPVQLNPGESYRLRYGVYIHDGNAEEADVASAYETFLKNSGG